MIVVLLGPDGSGKSSVIESLEAELAGNFAEIRILHLRPRLGRGTARVGPPVADPHSAQARSLILSAAKLLYLLVDYSTIHVWRWWFWWKRCSVLIIFDRYYHDLLVDPKRYRYGAPIWLARWIGHLVPRPDLWILLDASPEVIRSRKREVTLEESCRQCDAYRALMSELHKSRIVDASPCLAQVTQTVKNLILEANPTKGNSHHIVGSLPTLLLFVDLLARQ
jgi:thymidylate kinase